MSCDKFLQRDMKYQKRIIFNVVKDLDIMKGEITAIFDNSDYLYYSIFISFTLSKNNYMINIIYLSNFFVLSKSTSCMRQFEQSEMCIDRIPNSKFLCYILQFVYSYCFSNLFLYILFMIEKAELLYIHV